MILYEKYFAVLASVSDNFHFSLRKAPLRYVARRLSNVKVGCIRATLPTPFCY
jgi:hypothetical protein